jgi:hypothetical protein
MYWKNLESALAAGMPTRNPSNQPTTNRDFHRPQKKMYEFLFFPTSNFTHSDSRKLTATGNNKRLNSNFVWSNVIGLSHSFVGS